MENTRINELLQLAISQDASDVHLVVDKRPLFRIHGELSPSSAPILTRVDMHDMLLGMITEDQKEIFLEEKELDFSYASDENYQYRFNLSFEKGEMAATIRITPTLIPSKEELGLPIVVEELTKKRKGLILLSGTAGSGKSTTLNYLIDVINKERKCKIITIEDPIEYLHKSKQSLIVQREVGKDTKTFGAALKYALRQDPDVVVVGEMRDLESVSMALTTAETGHLVISTVHAPDAVETINRIIDVYPMGTREQIYVQMAENLIGIIGQMLVPSIDGGRRILATEVLISTLAIRNMIRRGALIEIRGQLDAEDERTHTYEACLSDLAKQKLISEETAKEYSKNLHLLKLAEEVKFGEAKKASIRVERDKSGEEKEEYVFQKRKILIVDDNLNDREKMTKALLDVGHDQFSYAEKGKNLLDQISLERPDIVVLDLGLGDADSFELCELIKGMYGNSIKVVLITGLLKPTDSDAAKNAGADDFVIKTSAFELLGKSVKKLSMVLV